MNVEKVLRTGILAVGLVTMVGAALSVVKINVDQNKSNKLYIRTLEQTIEMKEALIKQLKTMGEAK